MTVIYTLADKIYKKIYWCRLDYVNTFFEIEILDVVNKIDWWMIKLHPSTTKKNLTFIVIK